MAAASVMGIDTELGGKVAFQLCLRLRAHGKVPDQRRRCAHDSDQEPRGLQSGAELPARRRTEPFVFAACLNDRAQDGKDVSWIWDVDFERLTGRWKAFFPISMSPVCARTIWRCAFCMRASRKEPHSCAEGLRRSSWKKRRGKKLPVYRHADLYRDAGAARHDCQALRLSRNSGSKEGRIWN